MTDELVDCILKPGLQPGAAQARPFPLRNPLSHLPDAESDCLMLSSLPTPTWSDAHRWLSQPSAQIHQVFLDFISYSGGPLPEDLLPQLSREKCPVLIAWGEKDPWEPMNEGRRLYGGQPCVEDFIVLKGVGCGAPTHTGTAWACQVTLPRSA